MRDSEVVEAIVAGDPDGLAEAYDRYAAPLYTYCRSLLREPADAADAVQDTFVIAASKLAGLRDQNRLRPWLYAVARNECHRRLRESASAATSALDLAPEMSDETADVTGGAERTELRTLLRSAVRGLNASEQDLIELQLRQELDVAEVAAVLGVSRNHAHALLSRARSQLEVSLGALLVARSGRGDCAALSALLEDWDGQLNVLMRKRINRHIERCPECTERKRRELAPALLLGAAALPVVAMPPGLRSRVLRLASSNTPEATAHRAAVAQRAVMSGAGGFPVPLDQQKPLWWQARRNQGAAAAAVIAAAVVLIILVATGVLGAHHSQLSALSRNSSSPGAAASADGSGPAGTGPGGTGSAGAGGPGSSGSSGGPGPTASAAARVAPSPSAGSTAPGGPSPAASSPGPAPVAKPPAVTQPQPVAWLAYIVREQPASSPAARDAQRDAQDDRAQSAERRHSDPDRFGRPGELVHYGITRADRRADRRTGLGAAAGGPEHEHRPSGQRRGGRPDRSGRSRRSGRRGTDQRHRGVRELHAHRQSRRPHGHGPHRDQRQPEPVEAELPAVELSAVELSAAELVQPRSRDRRRVPRGRLAN
jgi:RNA polymerase sigma factor (sigma-70 family)